MVINYIHPESLLREQKIICIAIVGMGNSLIEEVHVDTNTKDDKKKWDGNAHAVVATYLL